MLSLLSRAAVVVCALAFILAAPTAAAADGKKRCASAKGQTKSKGSAAKKSCNAKQRRARKTKRTGDTAGALRIRSAEGDADPVTDIADAGTDISDPGTDIPDPGTDIPDPGTEIPAPAPALNPSKQCKAERDDPNFAATHGGLSFEDFYGTNQNRRNAFGKCVSGKAKAQGVEDESADESGDD